MNIRNWLLIGALFPIFSIAKAQNNYHYKIDLNNAAANTLQVELRTPKIKEDNIYFSFPKVIPGTYMISDYGKFISRIKAFDGNGNELPVQQESTDRWQIKNAKRLVRMNYTAEGIFDTKQKHPVFPMAATGIEPGQDFVINSPGFFGYFDGLREIPVEVEFVKPAGFFASTSLTAVSSTATADVFQLKSIHDLYDKPIMYSIPDTASIQVGNCTVLFSVYSPSKKTHASDVVVLMQPVMKAALQYLGGTLPANKYDFIYYMHPPSDYQSFPKGIGGALEHTTSSFYYIPDVPLEKMQQFITAGSAHEFFHIVTPLTISSREIKQFNYDSAVMSRHLWLYEGSTEYTANYIQKRYGLISTEEFLSRLSDKITNSQKRYIDTLPFTVLSKESAGKYNDQYGNVYEKGAMIACCLDLYLLHLSKGKYALRNLTHDLGVKYGINRAFEDSTLFDVITAMTYPEVRDFFKKYVEGNQPLDYSYFFGLAGIQYTPKTEKKIFSLGGFSYDNGMSGPVVIVHGAPLNEFGQKLGYHVGDQVYAFNGIEVNNSNLASLSDQIKSSMKEGAVFEVKIGRKNDNGVMDTMYLRAPAFKITVTDLNKLEPMKNTTEEQQMIQRLWLTNETDRDFIAAIKNK